ncbi:hypothetical protein MIND_00114500 [Mycena indigotica]|uniref:Uncharacterized protein n=1 Tax=Mycena indigotica TaxID=2126181 RepID=A0A8H6TEG4_9AGAR|nr:uncharacterized protein MIND_00114500 [Mycena indigotica]KAF7315975.1 hypothetical protein MIND_00114500 [Mycena indigotica]
MFYHNDDASRGRSLLLEYMALLILSILGMVQVMVKTHFAESNLALGNVQSDGSDNGTYYPSSLPLSVSQAAMEFSPTEKYALNASADWASLIPHGQGWVQLGKERQPFAVSMYHQLHCLNGLRVALRTPKTSRSPQFNSHTNHCFNYLRQLLLCKADTTLEPTKITQTGDGKVRAAASGDNVVHVCRNWVQIRRFVEENMRDYWRET